jgi:hypothetical protein
MDPANVTIWKLPVREHDELVAEADFASLAFVPVEAGEEPRVVCAVPERDAPTVRIDESPGSVRVRVTWETLGWGFWRDRRKFHLVFCIPQGMRLRVRADSARIEVARLRFRELDLEADAGSLKLERVEGRITCRTDAGHIVARDVSGSFDIRTDTGAIHVRAARLDAGRSSVATDMGTIHVELPARTPIRVDAKADMGAVSVDFPRYDDAAAILVAKSSLGVVSVSEYELRAEGEGRGPYRSPPPRAESEVIVIAPDAPPAAAAAAIDGEDPIDRIVGLVVAGKLSAREAEQLLGELEG